MQSAAERPVPAPTAVILGDTDARVVAGRIALQQCGFAVSATGPVERGVALARQHMPDVVVLVAPRPLVIALEMDEVVRCCPASRVVLLTGSRDLHDAVTAARAGVAGYLPDTMQVDSLRRALQHVLAGETVLPRDVLTSLTAQIRECALAALPGGDPDAALLTHRERQVLDLLRAGLSTRAIAKQLMIAPVTVRCHISSIVRKLDVRDRDALVQGTARR